MFIHFTFLASFFVFLTKNTFVSHVCIKNREILLSQLAEYSIFRYEQQCLARSDIANALIQLSQPWALSLSSIVMTTSHMLRVTGKLCFHVGLPPLPLGHRLWRDRDLRTRNNADFPFCPHFSSKPSEKPEGRRSKQHLHQPELGASWSVLPAGPHLLGPVQ